MAKSEKISVNTTSAKYQNKASLICSKKILTVIEVWDAAMASPISIEMAIIFAFELAAALVLRIIVENVCRLWLTWQYDRDTTSTMHIFSVTVNDT